MTSKGEKPSTNGGKEAGAARRWRREGHSYNRDPFLNSCTFTIARLFGTAISIATLLGVTVFEIAVSLKVDLV
ncbi:hypothetical protein N7499_010325 [Penicillium canescens]|uniref:Uncharacterized protein n=1 Tax=Penicillium canescens TaxID=5083 RepID=A0AAD6IHU5_PENCN|nr:uncharacterized protein N7446_005476 [Penicillium canescens]KAJ6050285.1 hypothetical protein N7444_007001 [Penicillium canescens]KAJ6050852.1 hypothetical protein N7460_001386 [Penicillium canescens]KAJ6061356.1 hypothetical protein N7446_005476 [Penicillium canescens]KAJ6068438.1 hypothetical protein N7499_010325 [Penicillium canescens]KAJ6183507.1 hypothetical protein N7485_002149 [Penicillium canescens]